MSGKVKVILGVLGTAILVSGIWATVMHFRTKAITEKFEGEISQLTATLDALGPSVDCYTVTEEYCNHYDNDTTGQVIQDNGLPGYQCSVLTGWRFLCTEPVRDCRKVL